MFLLCHTCIKNGSTGLRSHKTSPLIPEDLPTEILATIVSAGDREREFAKLGSAVMEVYPMARVKVSTDCQTL
jgi:hypothetical protein